MRVDIEKIQEALEVLADFNKLDLDTLDLYEKGVIIDIDSDTKREFEFIGLSNSSFIRYRYWENRLESLQTIVKENKDGKELSPGS